MSILGSNPQNAAGNAVWTTGNVGPLVGRVQGIAHPDVFNFSVEKVDNGFVLRSGGYEGALAKTRIAKDVDELKDMFVQILVEHRMEK